MFRDVRERSLRDWAVDVQAARAGALRHLATGGINIAGGLFWASIYGVGGAREKSEANWESVRHELKKLRALVARRWD